MLMLGQSMVGVIRLAEVSMRNEPPENRTLDSPV